METEHIYQVDLHQKERSYETRIFKIPHPRGTNTIVKMTYRAYNASESFRVETLVNFSWNPLISMEDLGYFPDSTIYIKNPEERKERANELIENALELVNSLLF